MTSMITATVLFTDVVASTTLRTRNGDVPAHRALAAHEAVIREAIRRHQGREVKTIGDGFMVVFTSANEAVSCAVEMQRLLAERRELTPEIVHVRIGIHTGDVIEQGGDVFGAAVDAATRIMLRARGGEILISEMVRGVVGAAADFNVRERGRFALKGFASRWRLYEVRWHDDRPAITRKQLTVVVTDVTGYTAATDRLTEDQLIGLVRSHSALVRAAASEHDVTFVKSIGDGFLLGFDRPAEAVACAAAVQRAFAAYREDRAAEPIHLKIAVHAGRFITEAGDLYGRDINLAFRLLGRARRDQVLVTEAVRSQLNGWIRVGPQLNLTLDNIREPQIVYEVDWSTTEPAASTDDTPRPVDIPLHSDRQRAGWPLVRLGGREESPNSVGQGAR